MYACGISVERRRLKKIPDDTELSFGNSVYNIRFESRQSKGTYGHKYWFWMQDAVDAPEYVVRWESFIELAATYGLESLYKEDFHTIYEKEQEPVEFKQLLTTMKVVDSRGESALDQDQWDAASTFYLAPFFKIFLLNRVVRLDIYIGFAFRKKAESDNHSSTQP